MLSAETNGAEISQMIDCTTIIETVIEKTSERHAASIQSISDDVKPQQKQIMEQQNQIKDMVTIVTNIASLIKQNFKGEGNSNLTTTSAGLNIQDGAQPPIHLNVSNEARSKSGDDQVSLQASNLFSQGVNHHATKSAKQPHNLKKGGVYLYYKEQLSLRQIETPYFSQCILYTLTIQNKVGYVAVIYRSPSQSVNEFDDFLLKFEKLLNQSSQLSQSVKIKNDNTR